MQIIKIVTIIVIKPLAKTGIIGTEMLRVPIRSEAYQRSVDTNSSVTPYTAQSKNNTQQPYEVKSAQSFSSTPSAMKNNNTFDSSPFIQKKPLIIDINKAFKETSMRLSKEAVTPQQENIDNSQKNNTPINVNAQSPAQTQPLIVPPSFSSLNLGGRFALKGIPKKQAKPRSDQLLLTYDKNHQSPIQEPTINIEPIVEHRDVLTEQSQNSRVIPYQLPITEHQAVPQRFDVNQMYVDGKITDLSPFIDNWGYYRTDFNNQKSHDNMLQEEILTSLNIKNEEGNLQVFDAVTDFKIIDTLLEKYKQDKNITRVLQTTRETIQHQFTSQQTTPRQGNSVIAYYLNENMANDIFTFMNTEPFFDQATHNITNMPSVEEIIRKALQNPNAQGYKALQATLEATNVAIYASRADRSFFGDGSLLKQLKSFEQRINTTLQKREMKQFQSWGSYASEAGASAFNATIGNMSIGSATSLSKSAINKVIPYTQGLINISGVKDMTISQVAEKTGLIKQENQIESNPTPMTRQQNEIQEGSYADVDKIIIKDTSNKIIAQYFTPAMQQDIMQFTGINPKRMSSIDTVITTALNNPSQEGFNALQSALEATRIALYAYRSESSTFGSSANFKQLQAFEQQIIQTLQDPRMTPFHSWTSQATSYATSFIPSVKTVLDTTGLGNMTIGQALTTVKTSQEIGRAAWNAIPFSDSAYHLGNAAVIASGVPNMTVSQGLTAAGIAN